jgi:transposase-like protein
MRSRKASLRCADKTEFFDDAPVRRLRCRDCCKRWLHAPAEITTRAHYQPCVVAAAVASDVLDGDRSTKDVAREHGCDRRTVRRWIDRVAQVAKPAELSERLLGESTVPALPTPPPVIPARRSARLAAVCLRAVWVLALLEALASLRGLAPPGLAHAHQFIPANATPTEIRSPAQSGK